MCSFSLEKVQQAKAHQHQGGADIDLMCAYDGRNSNAGYELSSNFKFQRFKFFLV